MWSQLYFMFIVIKSILNKCKLLIVALNICNDNIVIKTYLQLLENATSIIATHTVQLKFNLTLACVYTQVARNISKDTRVLLSKCSLLTRTRTLLVNIGCRVRSSIVDAREQ